MDETKDHDPLWSGARCLRTMRFVLAAGDSLLRIRACRAQDYVRSLVRAGSMDGAYAYAYRHVGVMPAHSVGSLGDYMWRYLLTHVEDAKGIRVCEDIITDTNGASASPLVSSSSWPAHAATSVVSHTNVWRAVLSWLPQLIGVHVKRWELSILCLHACGEAWRLVDLLPVSWTSRVRTVRPAQRPCADAVNVACNSVYSAAPTESSAPPLSETEGLAAEYYDLVLLQCVSHQPTRLGDALERLRGRFRVPVLMHAVGEALEKHMLHAMHDSTSGQTDCSPASTSSIIRALGLAYATLLLACRRYRAALHLMLQLGEVRTLLRHARAHQLYRELWDMLPALLTRDDAGEAMRLLLEHATDSEDGMNSSANTSNTTTTMMAKTDRTQVYTGDDRSESISMLSAWLVPDWAASQTDTRREGRADVLRPPSVLRRLRRRHRPHLMRYLNALSSLAPNSFTRLAHAHPHELVTLYLEYDRDGLLPLLRIAVPSLSDADEDDIFARCQWHRLRDAALLLLLHKNQGEKGLRTIILETHHMPRALRLIAQVRSRKQRVALFRTLVDLAMQDHMSLPTMRRAPALPAGCTCAANKQANNKDSGGTTRCVCDASPPGCRCNDAHTGAKTEGSLPKEEKQRYTLHRTRLGEGWADVAALYNVDECALRRLNAGACDGGGRSECDDGLLLPAGTVVRVPLNVVSSLLQAVAEAQRGGRAMRGVSSDDFIDVDYLLRALPASERLTPTAWLSVAALLRQSGESVTRQTAAMHIAEATVMWRYGELLRRRSAAVRVGGGGGGQTAHETRCCAACGLRLGGGEDVWVWRGGRVAHAHCAEN